MTIAFVQAKTVNAAWTGSFSTSVAAGDTVFLFAWQYTNSGATMSSNSPTFGGSPASGASQVLQQQGPGAATVYGTIWMLPDLAGGAASFGLTNVNGTVDTNVGIVALEFSGLGASPSLDSGASPNPETGSGSSGTAASGSTGNITSAPELIVAMAIMYGTSITPPGSPWTNNNPGNAADQAGYQIVASSGSSYSYSMTAGTGQSWVAGIAAIEAASAGPPAVNIPPFLAPMRLT